MHLLRRPDEEMTQIIDLHAEFRAAWDRLEIHTQDVHSTADGSIHAAEALLRWRRKPGSCGPRA